MKLVDRIWFLRLTNDGTRSFVGFIETQRDTVVRDVKFFLAHGAEWRSEGVQGSPWTLHEAHDLCIHALQHDKPCFSFRNIFCASRT